ncbi:hypothetical protein [Paenibacillus sp. FSL H3-0286]|uniref:hypothetical protein n=1 Tax=Paenibacillus sp. FSL H3-0286 TaxID=2921427 RepID=UPI0032558A89
MINIDESIELKFLHGLPVELYGLNISSPIIKEIIKVGYSSYNKALSSLLLDKNNIAELKNLDQSNLELIIYFFERDPSFKEAFSLGIKLMFDESVSASLNEYSISLQIGEVNITEEMLFSIQQVVKFANKVSDKTEEEEFNPANSKAEEFIRKIMGDRAKKPQKKPVSNFHSLVSSLAWKHDLRILEGNLSIYQFYDGYYRLENINHYNNIMTGIYSGNIDSTKIKIQENNWVKIIT